MYKNCWELNNCHNKECPVHSATLYDGINHGKNGGRLCWFISGTFCGNVVQGTFAKKKLSCATCEVYKSIREEEKAEFLISKLHILN